MTWGKSWSHNLNSQNCPVQGPFPVPLSKKQVLWRKIENLLEYSGIVACFLTWKLQSELINYSTVMCWSYPCTEEFVLSHVVEADPTILWYSFLKLQTWVIILGALVTPNWLIQSHPIEKERWSPYQICHTVLYVKSLLFSHPGTVFILCVGEHRWSGKFLQSWNCEGQTVH